MTDHKRTPHRIVSENLPKDFPTHAANEEFWVELGRTVATFGFLEEILGKAIFALTATRDYSEDKIEKELERWFPTLLKALSDPLNGLIEKYLSELKKHPDNVLENILEFEADLKQLPSIRNVLCHGSWRPLDDKGFSKPFYCNRKGEIWDSEIDVQYLRQVRMAARNQSVNVVNSITSMGWSFPGSDKAGTPIWPKS